MSLSFGVRISVLEQKVEELRVGVSSFIPDIFIYWLERPDPTSRQSVDVITGITYMTNFIGYQSRPLATRTVGD